MNNIIYLDGLSFLFKNLTKAGFNWWKLILSPTFYVAQDLRNSNAASDEESDLPQPQNTRARSTLVQWLWQLDILLRARSIHVPCLYNASINMNHCSFIRSWKKVSGDASVWMYILMYFFANVYMSQDTPNKGWLVIEQIDVSYLEVPDLN